MWKPIAAAAIGVVLSVGVAIHEWSYHQAHKYATGVSGVLVVLSLAVAFGCAAAGLIAWEIGRRDTEEARRILQPLRRES